MPLNAEYKDSYEGLEDIAYESKQWIVQTSVVLSRLRMGTSQKIDFDAVFQQNIETEEEQVSQLVRNPHARVF